MHVFAYGSLVDPRCLDNVLGHPHLGERLAARLAGFERRTSSTYPYPFVEIADGRTVDGVLIMDLDAADLAALDRYEEVDDGVYQRTPVEVETWGCGPRSVRLPAFVYVRGPALGRVTAT
ncbi:MAG TPA: gamma-glutamylcyclotransferase family protein [Chloroflexota bacterium]|jgi:gamma-glutamylcyclotransferase (GGCT)/AIG2-like uncharacterized protein YtfP|nr:gamma-glutamylcyclotransferase family protein [Chloroflexota bacterium]